MKVNFNQNSSFVTTPSFKGFEHKKNDNGVHEYNFNFPYDDTKYDAYVELFKVGETEESDKFVALDQLDNKNTNKDSITLKKGGVSVDLSREFGLKEGQPFAYRYKLVNKNNDEKPLYVTEAGILIKSNYEGVDGNFNLYSPSGTAINKGGAMLLGMYDNFNAGFVYDDNGKPVLDKSIKEKAAESSKTFSNKIGGTLAGLEEKIPYLKKVGYSRILLTPIFTDDSLSSHGYWIKNPYQMVQSAGSINNYESLTKKMFKSGMNLVADGAFVNEGLEGVHFKDVLKWGKKSPYYEWFRFEDIEGGPLSMGVFSKNQKNIGHKVVNAPFKYVQNTDVNDKKYGLVTKTPNHSYDPKKPTYIQIFDKRLVSKADVENSQKLIREYDTTKMDNLYDVNTHNDTVIPYSFEIRPESYEKNIEDFNEMNNNRADNQKKIPLNSPLAARILTKSDSYVLEDKFENKFETWDANTDIAKLNYITSEADLIALNNLPRDEKLRKLDRLRQRNVEAQDFAITAAKYWTKKTDDIILVGAAQELGKIGDDPKAIKAKIDSMVKKGELPKSLEKHLSEDKIENALFGLYPLKRTKRVSDRNDLLISGMMDLPLESIELGDDISAIFGYPQVTKRANDAKEVGVSKYLMSKNANPHLLAEYEDDYMKMQSIYQNDLKNFGVDVIDELNKSLDPANKLLKANNASNSTQFGTYVLPIIGQDIAKFAIIKSLYPKADVQFKDGKILYDYKELKSVTLKDLNIKGDTPDEQAKMLISKLKSGIKKISEDDKKELAKVLYERIKNTNVNSFKVSELIIDSAQSGLDWRIDATKDIADTDALRNGHSTFESYWQNVTNFWSLFTNRVRKENPNSYFTAEITDEGDLIKMPATVGGAGRYADSTDAVNKFLQETGIQSTPNYSYMFTDMAKVVGKSFEDGGSIDKGGRDWQIYDILASKNGRKYLNSTNMDALIYSYTFSGNHDKPRTLHCLGLDMELFHTNFKDNQNYRQKAADILQQDKNKIDFDIVSGKAIAMADVAKNALEKAIDAEFPNDDKKRWIAKESISKAIADLAQGSYMGKHFSPDVFGVKPYDKTIDAILTQAEEKHGLNDSVLSKKDKKLVANKAFEIMLTPAISKFKALMSYLVLLPGNPTLFAGDELGLTGYDEKCKNVYLQNRSYLNWDYVDENNKDFKKFLKDSQNEINSIMALRAKPELAPLNTGAPFALKPQFDIHDGDKKVTGLLRQNSDGAMVISLFNATGTTLDEKQSINDSKVVLNNINLSSDGLNDGIKAGLPVGTIFYNEDPTDKARYEVKTFAGEYVINKVDEHNNYQPLEISKPTLVLYHKPNSERANNVESEVKSKDTSFTGKKVLYNPQYHFVSDPYKKAEPSKIGQKLMLV